MSRIPPAMSGAAVLVLAVLVGCQAAPNTAASADDATSQPSRTAQASASATSSATASPPASASASASVSPVELCLEASVKDAWHNIGTHTADAATRSAAADALEELELDGEAAELRDELVAALRSNPFNEMALALAATAWEGNIALPTC